MKRTFTSRITRDDLRVLKGIVEETEILQEFTNDGHRLQITFPEITYPPEIFENLEFKLGFLLGQKKCEMFQLIDLNDPETLTLLNELSSLTESKKR